MSLRTLAGTRSRRLLQSTLLGIAALGVSCGGGGGSSSSSGVTGGSFQLVSINGMPAGFQSAWKLNRPIEFQFSSPVNFSSINSSSIQIRTATGQQALGEFYFKPLTLGGVDTTTVVFQPRCPTEDDLSDSGLELGANYTLTVVGKDGNGGLAVKSAGGATLSTSQERMFVTPSSSLAAELFFDVKDGPAVVRVALATDNPTEGDAFSSILKGGDREWFRLDANLEPVLISDVPINLYSGGDQRVEVYLEFDQPVNPSASNINQNRIRLQFFDPTLMSWIDLGTTPTLVKNCTLTGALVRLDPVGILPPGVDVRVEIAAAFEDIVGDQNVLAVNNFSLMETAIDLDPSFNPQAVADEVLESFDDTVYFDDTVLPEIPLADWGAGRLSAAFDFPISTTVPTNFDFVVETGTIETVNTVADVILGGNNGAPEFNQVVSNGVIFCRNLDVQANATLLFQGPNPARIYATGTVRINGTIRGQGFDANPVNALGSAASITGALGNLGGGSGGFASPSNVITLPDVKGGDGFGPNELPNFGGKGGESGFGNTNDANRRVGGGGGGVTNNALFGTQFHTTAPTIQTPGNDGTATVNDNPVTGAKGCVSGVSPPRGGGVGSSLFVDNPINNNFFGLRKPGANLIVGELSAPTAGSGGGAGGDSIRQVNFPGNFVQSNNMRGASGAGGGGHIEIRCLQTFSVVGQGRIIVAGGRGDKGEQAPSDPRGVGGGSGGGSGGHIIVQSATRFDFSAATGVNTNPIFQAQGGLGGPGKNGNGGTFGSAGSGEAGGGNGSQGIVQIHAPQDDGIAPAEIILPAGVTQPALGRPAPFTLLPTFGAQSRAESRAIAIGGANQNPNSVLPQVQYTFSTLPVATTFIPTNGAGVVTNEASILSGTTVTVDNTGKFVTVDATALFNDTVNNVYLRNVQLLRNFQFRLIQGGLSDQTVASATFDVGTKVLRLNLEGTPDLSGFTSGVATFQLRPRFYRVRTDGVLNSLPLESRIGVQFQGLQKDIAGAPGTILVDWTSDIDDLSTSAQDLDFVKFRVNFNLDASSDGLTGTEKLPTLEFLRFILEF